MSKRPHATHSATWPVLLALAGACSGQIGTELGAAPIPAAEPPTGAPAPAGAPPSTSTAGAPRTGACAPASGRPSPRRLRRLSATELRNTLADLTGTRLPDGESPVEDVLVLGYDNNAAALGIDVKDVQRLLALSARLGAAVAADPAKHGACAPGATDAACAASFIDQFGRRAWRRPLTAMEKQRLVALYDLVKKAGAPHAAGLAEITRALLGSPKFLFRFELGTERDGTFRLTDHELASALSYLFWETMPDAELMAAADSARLSAPAELSRQARRLAADPRATRTMARFLRQYAGVYDADRIADKNTTVHRTFRPELAEKMLTELELYLTAALDEGKGRLSAVMNGAFTVIDRSLATFYGISAPSGSSFARVALDGDTRRGLFTQGAYLATHAQAVGTAPLERGIFVRERFLCTPVPPPPPGELPALTFESKDVRTTRQRFVAHATNPACGACHALFDQLGFAFENYDAVGLYRTTENGAPIDASGVVAGLGDADGPFTNAVTLAQRLSASQSFQDCFVRHAFRFASGRAEDDGDACTIQQAATRGATSGDLNVAEVLVALATSEAFTTRRNDR